jgi:hypothetical protein
MFQLLYNGQRQIFMYLDTKLQAGVLKMPKLNYGLLKVEFSRVGKFKLFK